MSYTTVAGLFTGIADAIRGKEDTTDPIAHQDMPARITALETGSTPSLQDKSVSPNFASGNVSVTADAGYDGLGTVTINKDATNHVEGNIKSGATIYGVAGSSSVVDTSDADAVAADIADGKFAYVNGAKLTGTATGGASLPSSITAIDGGSFTLASNTACNAYQISHALGLNPIWFNVWTADSSVSGDSNNYFLISVIVLTPVAVSGTTGLVIFRVRDSSNAVSYANQGYAYSSFYSTTMLLAYSSVIKYKSGVTYKWASAA